MITAERLRELLDYDPSTGIFIWKVSTSNRAPTGSVAGCMGGGRLVIRIDGTLYLASRLAWVHYYGDWPSLVIDHLDGNPRNNRINNLRDVSQAMNTLNIKGPRVDNTSGFLGVSKEGNRWVAQLGRGGWRARFDTPEEASEAYQARKRELLPS